MSSPFFTIIIPTFNRAHLIRRTLESALSQKFESYEIIVIDDGSTDETAAVVAGISDPRLKYYYQQNRERGAARNHGIDLASGKYITFCDSDDLLLEDYLKNAHESILAYGDLNWLHLAYEIRRLNGKAIPMQLNEKTFIRDLASGNPLSCMGVFVKAEILRKTRFNENRHLSGSEDWELWLRIAANNPIVIDKRISSALLMHDERSVVHTSELKLQLRKYLSIGYAFEDPMVKKVFSPYYVRMNAYFDTYISLHLLLSGKNSRAMVYLLKAFFKVPSCIIERRFLAIIKLLLKNNF
jgi:glycosyltransferase involved in cell wall biosynthesis